MKLTVNDFYGYMETCQTIIQIKEWIESIGGQFTYNELIEKFPFIEKHHRDNFLKYLKPDRADEFFDNFLKTETIERYEESKQFLEVLKRKQSEMDYEIKRNNKEAERLLLFEDRSKLVNELEFLKGFYERTINESKVLFVLQTMFDFSFKEQSYQTTNSIMYSTLSNLLEVAKFRETDFKDIMKKYNFGYWGGNHVESFYATAIVSNNNSAWKSIESAIERQPFIVKGKRVYERFIFKIKEDKLKLRCTGFTENKKVKFVSENTEKQKRFQFDNKEFKDFIKNKTIIF